MNIGAAVRQIRKSKGVSQVELAEKIGVSQAMLCQIERNEVIVIAAECGYSGGSRVHY